MKKIYWFFILVIILLVVAGCVVWFSLILKPAVTHKTTATPVPTQTPVPTPAPTLAPVGILDSASFTPLEKQAIPPFIKNIRTSPIIKVGFHYDGDYTSKNDWSFDQQQFYTPPGSSENFLVVSKVKNRQNFDYGSTNSLPIFKSEESHSYQGTPIYITNSYGKYSLSYLGFKINDASLISELSVELGIDYNAQDYDTAVKTNNFSIASLLGIETAYACGPGLYLRKVGNSALDFVQKSDGIMWYKLKTPISMYNLSLQYADQDCSKMPSYCHNFADDPQDCDKYFGCYYNSKISDLSKGNLRMHVYYKANDKEGLLKMQMANLIVSDENGIYYQATMREDFNHYYRAYLH